MGFRIHRGIFQKLEADGRTYTNTSRVGDDGRLKEVDSDGNIVGSYLTSVPSEFVTQTEGDGRYVRLNGSSTIIGGLAVHAGSQKNHGFEISSSVATYRSDAPYWRLWQPNSTEQIAAVNGGEVRLSYDGTTRLKTYNGGVQTIGEHKAGAFKLEGGPSLINGGSTTTYWNSGSTSSHYIQFRRSDNVRTGGIYWDSNGNYFGLLNKDGQWAVRTDATHTRIYYDGSEKLRTDSSGSVTEGRHHINGYLYSTSYGEFNGDVKGNRFVDRNNTGFYVDPAGSSRVSGLTTDYYLQATTGVPRNNLGSPTVTEMALFDSQFTCKTDLSNDYTNLTYLTFWVQQNEGDAWTEVAVDDYRKRQFLRTNNSNVVIPNRAYKFRVEFHAKGYTFANAIYFYWSSNSHNSQVHIWKQRSSDLVWLQHTNSPTTVSSWPGHLWLPFGTIAWQDNGATNKYEKIRVEFTPNWSTGSYADRNINLYGGQIWGGYPSGRRTPHRINEDGNYYFPNNLYLEGGTSNNHIAVSRGWMTWSNLGGKPNVATQEWANSQFARIGAEDIIDGAYSIWNADGNGDVFKYDDSNPNHNGKGVGAVIEVTGDGAELNSLVRAGIYTADHISVSRGYYVGNVLDTANSTTTQVINDRGQWVGDPTGLVGPQGPAGATGPQGPQGPQGPAGSDATISFTNNERGTSSTVQSITFDRGEAQFTMADGSVMVIGGASMR